MRQLFSVILAATAILFCSCSGSYKKTKDGLQYKIFAGKGKDSLLKAGDFVKFNIEYILKRKGKSDTLMYSTYKGMPTYNRVDTTSTRNDMNFTQLLPMMRAGDSAEFKVSVDSLIARNLVPMGNPLFTKGAVIIGKMAVVQKFSTEADVMADIQKEIAAEKVKEMAQVQSYFKSKGINPQMTKDSVFVLVENPGDQTAKADSGLQVSVKYTGKLMDNDTIFDTNMDKSMQHDQPLDLVLGQHMVIPGWESGLKLFGKGGKGKIFIPAFMGYGPQGGGKIPANANLVFDVEVLDVKKPEPKKAEPAPQIQMPTTAAPQEAAPKGK